MTSKTKIKVFHFLLTCSSLIYVSLGDGILPQSKISSKPIWNATLTDKLRHDLLLNYDKFARPTQHYNKTTVRFGIYIKHVEVDEFKSTFTVYSWDRFVWNDDKLKWNASDYGDLNVLHLADHEIWQPDICLYNSASANGINGYTNTHCLVYPNGEILWVPPTQHSVLCEYNLRYWPFDTQECSLTFGSWTYHGEQIDMQMYNTNQTAELDMLAANSEWEVIGTKQERHEKFYDCCSEMYPDITISLTVKRRSPSYKALIITPAFAIIMMTLMSFWLPPNAGEKIILNGCTAIVITLFMLYFAQKIPIMGTHTPLIVFFFSSSLYIICFSMAISIFVLWLSRTKHTKPLPWIVKQPLTGWLGKWLCLSYLNAQSSISSHRTTAEEMRDHQVTDFEEHNTNDDHQMIGMPSTNNQQDWVLLAVAVDRISFIFYSMLFVILALAYSL